ncbi:DNA starvation/stationary phase protection protein [soil metagenome]
MAKYTVPGMSDADAKKVRATLQQRLTALTDLHLTLKHIHWNVVGPNFISVHEMLDPHIDAIRLMSDDIAERIATLGGEPLGTPGAIVKGRTWDDYSVNRATTDAHLGALDVVYQGVIADHREAIKQFDDLDLVSQDMMIGQSDKLEMYHWFVRAHLEDKAGNLSTAGATSEGDAASKATRVAPKRAARKRTRKSAA